MADKRFRGRDKIVQKMTKDGLVEENLRTGETKSAVAEEPPKQEDSEKDAVESAEETPVVEEEVCMDAEEGEEEKPRRSTAKQSTEYYKAHQEDGKAKEKDAPPVDEDAEPAPKKKGRLSFDDEQQGGIVRGAGLGIKKVAKKGVDTATGFAHNKVHQVEKENSGVESAHKSEETLEGLYRFSKGRKKTREKSARAEKKVEAEKKSSRLKFSENEGGITEEAAEMPLKKKPPQPPPTAAGGEATKTVGSKFYQKQQYKDAYAAAKRGRKTGNAASKQAATAANTLAEKAKAAVQEIVVQNKTLWAGLGIAALMLMLIMGAFSSCSAAIQGTGSTFIGTTYPSKDADMKGAEEDYLELEKKLDEQIRQMESTHPGYDEYRYQLDEIGYDPYQLISHLTAVYEQFTRGQVKTVIKSLFEQQYLLKVWETIEIRTRMETRVGIRPTIDAFGNVSMETYTYQEEVEYEYKMERMGYILAYTLNYNNHDGRYSHSNKEWADTTCKGERGSNIRTDWIVRSHPAVLNGFVDMYRKELAAEQQREPEKPFVQQFYVVTDLQTNPMKIEKFGNLDDAMSCYQQVPNFHLKALGVEKTPDPLPGSLDIVQCKNGIDTIVEDYKKVPGWDNPYIQNHVVALVAEALKVQDVAVAYEINNGYFHIQTSEDGYDYTLYNKDFTVMDGGIIEVDGYRPVQEVMEEVLAEHGHSVSECGVISAEYLQKQSYRAETQRAEAMKEKLAAEKPAPEASISFYVAECAEFPVMGEFHDNLTLEQALEIYDKIPAERMNGIKSIGFSLEDGSIYSGMFDLIVGGEVQAEVVNHIQHYRESPLVQKAISDMKTLLEKRQASKELEERPNTRQSVREALKNRKKAQEQQSNQEQAKPKKAKKRGEMEL